MGKDNKHSYQPVVGYAQQLPDSMVSEKPESVIKFRKTHEPGCTPSVDPLFSDQIHRLEASNGSTWYDPMVEYETNLIVSSGLDLGIQRIPAYACHEPPDPLCDRMRIVSPPSVDPMVFEHIQSCGTVEAFTWHDPIVVNETAGWLTLKSADNFQLYPLSGEGHEQSGGVSTTLVSKAKNPRGRPRKKANQIYCEPRTPLKKELRRGFRNMEYRKAYWYFINR